MHSALFISFIASAALTAAAPVSESRGCKECPGVGAYYVCSSNGFKGHCSIDPCGMKWCPDFKYKTCYKKPICKEKIVTTSCTTFTITKTYTDDYGYPTSSLSYSEYYPTETSTYDSYRTETPSYDSYYPTETSSSYDTTSTAYPTETYSSAEPESTADAIEKRTAFYVCAKNSFRGDCSVDPCAMPWCPDYKYKTYEPVEKPKPQQLYYQCASNKFDGMCSVDPCAISWCPDYEYKTYEPVTSSGKSDDGTKTNPKSQQLYYQCASNKFDGLCSVDPCALNWCPDYKEKTYTPASPASQPDTSATKHKVFYVCGNNGFRGDCSVDPCAMPWCPDYQYKTYTPVVVY